MVERTIAKTRTRVSGVIRRQNHTATRRWLNGSRSIQRKDHQATPADARVKSEDRATRRAVGKMKDNVEKTTLGDISALASLKQNMEDEAKAKLEKMSKEKKTTAAKKKESDSDKAKEEDKK